MAMSHLRTLTIGSLLMLLTFGVAQAAEQRLALVIGNDAYTTSRLKRAVGDARAIRDELQRLNFDVTFRENALALVIGNDAYIVEPLKRAASDARAIGQELQRLHFDVTIQENVDRLSTLRAIDDFARKLSPDAVAVFYFAGHGIEVDGANYLIPTDLRAQQNADVDADGVNLARTFTKLATEKPRFVLAIIDACRDNPLRLAARGNKRAIGGLRGLAGVPAAGTMVVYSAGVNQTALDWLDASDRDPNGLFTRELLQKMREPGLPIREVIARVKSSVIERARSVNHVQTPAVYDESIGDFYFINPQ
jgi:uncharacterized caspase-like protein